jgi:hypothetical protein
MLLVTRKCQEGDQYRSTDGLTQGYLGVTERTVRLGSYCDFVATGMIAAPLCAECGSPSMRIELVAPGELPIDWERWPSTVRGTFLLDREPGQWYLIFMGVATENGYGNTVDASRARGSLRRFSLP